MTKKTNRVSFDVSFVLPPGATIEAARAYVADAVASMKGALKPPYHEVDGIVIGDPGDPDGDPMFHLDGETVRVVRRRTV